MANIIDSTVVASAYTTSASARPQILSNGWIVTAELSGGSIYFQVSKDNGATWLVVGNTTSGLTATMFSIASNGTWVYLIQNNSTTNIAIFGFDVATFVLGTAINGGSAYSFSLETPQTAFSGCSLAIGSTGTYLHACWSSKNSTYPNSFNLRYSKGTIATDGSVTWGTVVQLTTQTNSNVTAPCIFCKGAIPYIIACYFYNGSNYYMAGLTTAYTSRGMGIAIPTDWGDTIIYSGFSYSQSSPSAIFVPQSINGLANGRIWVAWHGLDATVSNVHNIRISYSDDNGVTWSTMAKLTTDTLGSQLDASITANGIGDVFIVYEGGVGDNYYPEYRIKVLTKLNGGSWISEVINSNNITTYMNPSALFDFTFNTKFTKPLYIFRNNVTSSVRFYGNWSVTTISVTQGSIGNKSDKTNLLSYAITTDGTMSTITETLNGVVTGTKTATSGQSLIAGLTQAQWDSVKYGKYKDATMGLNTLTVSMGSDVFTYTFDKRLATTDDINSTMKAVSDSNDTFLPSIKQELVNKIGGLTSSSFDSLISGIALGKKSASGTVTSSSGGQTFSYVNGSTVGECYVTVTGLIFKPSIIILKCILGGTVERSVVYDELVGGLYAKEVRLSSFNNYNSSTSTENIKGDVSPANVAFGTFKLPVTESSVVYTWFAIE